MRTILFRAALVLVLLWVGFVGFIAWAMHQPPETFGRVMARMPVAAYFVIPFETLWTRARAGYNHRLTAPTGPNLNHRDTETQRKPKGSDRILLFSFLSSLCLCVSVSLWFK